MYLTTLRCRVFQANVHADTFPHWSMSSILPASVRSSTQIERNSCCSHSHKNIPWSELFPIVVLSQDVLQVFHSQRGPVDGRVDCAPTAGYWMQSRDLFFGRNRDDANSNMGTGLPHVAICLLQRHNRRHMEATPKRLSTKKASQISAILAQRTITVNKCQPIKKLIRKVPHLSRLWRRLHAEFSSVPSHPGPLSEVPLQWVSPVIPGRISRRNPVPSCRQMHIRNILGPKLAT